MSNAKHTPGPWKVDSGMVQTVRKVLSGGLHIPIAYMNRKAGNGTQPCERNANARLIAAAPDLLAALRLAKDAFYTLADNAGDVPEWNECGECYIAAEAVKAAIAKAEGAE